MTIGEAKQKIQVAKKYKHYKGKIYSVDFIATNTETSEPMVVYHEYGTTEYFVRSADMWLETINKPRFELLVED